MWNTRPARSLIGVLLLASFLAFVQSDAVAKTADLPPNVHRVLFLGDSITYGGQYISDIEAYFVTRHPDRHIEFMNLGLPSETVSGLCLPHHSLLGPHLNHAMASEGGADLGDRIIRGGVDPFGLPATAAGGFDVVGEIVEK